MFSAVFHFFGTLHVFVLGSKMVESQGFRANGHQIRILLIEICQYANFQSKRMQPAHVFSNFSIFWFVFPPTSIENQGFRVNGHQIRILLIEIYKLGKFQPKRKQPAHVFNSFLCFWYVTRFWGQKSKNLDKRTSDSKSAHRDIWVGKI